MNYVLKYTVSDTETLRRVHLFVWAEEYDGAKETRVDSFSAQNLPAGEGRARIDAFLGQARLQSASTCNPDAAAAATDAVTRLESLLARNP
ncbi:MAG: hypothetical protein K8T20_05605 [Planctomycetes bacterium]|nr:hypothetical protein [Planctomycetota bacterium]